MRKFLYFLQYLAYWGVTRAIRLVPHSMASRIGERLGRWCFLLPIPQRQRALDNLSRVFPQADPAKLRTVARNCFGKWGRMVFEIGSLGRFDREELIDLFDVVGQEHLDRAKARQQGVLIVSGHFSPFEMCSYYIAVAVGGIHALVRPPSNPWIAAELAALRSRFLHHAIPRRRSAFRLAKVLRDGGITGLAPDQRVRPSEGVIIDFLGVPAWTSTMPAYLAGRHQSALVLMTCEPIAGGRARVTYHEPIFTESSNYAEVLGNTLKINQTLGDFILEQPELWLWMHHRWLRSPLQQWPESLARLRRDSQLPDSSPAVAPPGGSAELIECLDDRTLENGRSVLVVSDQAQTARELLAEAGRSVVGRGHPVLFADTPELLDRLSQSPDSATREQSVRKIDRYDLLILDRFEEAARSVDNHPALSFLLSHRSGSRSILAAVESPELPILADLKKTAHRFVAPPPGDRLDP